MSPTYNLIIGISVTCDATGKALLSLSFPFENQTAAQILASMGTNLAEIPGELATLGDTCSHYTLNISDPQAGINNSVSAASALLLVAQAYVELLYILATL